MTTSVTVVYGSLSGTTKSIASRIAKRLNAKMVNIKNATTEDMENCDLLILGVPTYGDGILQADWEDKIDTLKSANLFNKKVALFGLGDQDTYPDSFLDAMGILYDQVVEQGANVIGFTDTEGFTYNLSTAEVDGKFVGLAIDQDTQSDQTEERIEAWISQLA